MTQTNNSVNQKASMRVGIDLPTMLQQLYGDLDPNQAQESQWMVTLAAQEETLYALYQAVMDIPWVLLNHSIDVKQADDLTITATVSSRLDEDAFIDAVELNTSQTVRADQLDERILVRAPDGLAYNVLDIPEIASFGTVSATTDGNRGVSYHLEKKPEAIRHFLAQESMLANHALAQIANQFDLLWVLGNKDNVEFADYQTSSAQLEQITLRELWSQHDHETFKAIG